MASFAAPNRIASRFHANKNVVFLVLMGVDDIITEGPEEACRIEMYAGGEPPRSGGIAEQSAPIER